MRATRRDGETGSSAFESCRIMSDSKRQCFQFPHLEVHTLSIVRRATARCKTTGLSEWTACTPRTRNQTLSLDRRFLIFNFFFVIIVPGRQRCMQVDQLLSHSDSPWLLLHARTFSNSSVCTSTWADRPCSLLSHSPPRWSDSPSGRTRSVPRRAACLVPEQYLSYKQTHK